MLYFTVFQSYLVSNFSSLSSWSADVFPYRLCIFPYLLVSCLPSPCIFLFVRIPSLTSLGFCFISSQLLNIKFFFSPHSEIHYINNIFLPKHIFPDDFIPCQTVKHLDFLSKKHFQWHVLISSTIITEVAKRRMMVPTDSYGLTLAESSNFTLNWLLKFYIIPVYKGSSVPQEAHARCECIGRYHWGVRVWKLNTDA